MLFLLCFIIVVVVVALMFRCCCCCCFVVSSLLLLLLLCCYCLDRRHCLPYLVISRLRGGGGDVVLAVHVESEVLDEGGTEDEIDRGVGRRGNVNVDALPMWRNCCYRGCVMNGHITEIKVRIYASGSFIFTVTHCAEAL